MDEPVAYQGIILRRFFNEFSSIIYRGVPVCKYIYYPFWQYINRRWNFTWAQKNWPGLFSQMNNINESEIYHWFDDPYCYDPHPNGRVLMRGGFGDIASLYLPNEHFVLLSPNQAEVDLIKTNRPDLTAHNIERYYRENSAAVECLNQQITELINGQKDDPILGSPDLLQWFKSCTPNIVRVFDAVQSIVENFNIGAVLSISSIVWMDSALNLVARANQIPSFTLQHGLILDRDLFCHIPITATKKLVWGDEVQRWYKKYGYPESRVSVIGSPRFDPIFTQNWCGKPKLCQMLNIDPSKKIVVYATGTDMNTIVPMVLQGLASNLDLFLILTLHPSEASLVARYQKLTEGYPNCKVVRFGEISLYDSLSGADIFITQCSTAGLEAMLFKLPVITVEPTPLPFSYGDLGASLRVTSSTELNQVVNRLISDEIFRAGAINRYQNFLSGYCVPDGCASRRLFDQVELLCRSGGIA